MRFEAFGVFDFVVVEEAHAGAAIYEPVPVMLLRGAGSAFPSSDLHRFSVPSKGVAYLPPRDRVL